MKKTFYTLFFSFKGGVGRTSAMMNTALYLARKKKRVLIVDFDLHAPGVDAFDVVDEELQKIIPSYNPVKIYKYRAGISESTELTADEISKAPQGMVELFAYWAAHGILPPLDTPSEDVVADWQEKKNRYVYRIPPHELGDGDIFVIRAGNHDDKEHFTSTLQYVDRNTEKFDPGFGNYKYSERIFEADKEHTKRQKPEFVYELQSSIEKELKPDYVLIDSRPGNDWVSALAKTWLSECIVLTFNLNPWNMNGIIDVYSEMLRTPYHRGTPNILLLATPIPRYARTSKLYVGQHQHIQDKMKEARNSGLGSEGGPIEVPYAEILALRDVLITDAQESDPAVDSYRRLGDLIISGNVNDLENRIKAASEERDTPRIMQAFTRLVRQYPQEIPLLFEYGKFLYKINRLHEANVEFDSVWRLLPEGVSAESLRKRRSNPYYQDTLYNRTKVKIALVQEFLDSGVWDPKFKAPLETLEDLGDEIRLFIAITKEESTEFSSMYGLLGDLMLTKAELLLEFDKSEKRLTSDSEAYQCLVDAAAQYQKAKDSGGQRNEEYVRGKGNVLARQSLFDPGAETIQKALEAYEETIRMRNDNPISYLQLGRNYLKLAAIKNLKDVKEMPILSFLDRSPFVERIFNEWSVVKSSDLDSESLDRAEKGFNYTIQFRQHEFFAYFNRGIVRMLKAGILLGSRGKPTESVYKLINNATSDFDQANLYQPGYSPSYFYSGTAQFLVRYLEAGELSAEAQNKNTPKSGMPEIRFRQAFYHLEHFIDQQIKSFMKIYIEKSFHAGDERRQDLLNELDKLIGIKDETNDPFYFDPSDIDKIEQRSLDFLYTIEFYMDFPGILEIILGSTEKLARDKNFIYLIANHLEKDREMNLDKDRDHPVRQANLFGNRIRSLEEM